MMTEIRINPTQKDILIAGAGYVGKALAIDYLKKMTLFLIFVYMLLHEKRKDSKKAVLELS